MDYKAPDNVYWLFSSSSQAIAAFIGFLTAGFYFVLDKMDSQVARDSTLNEINQEIKRSHFTKLKTICVLTGASILFSLGLVFGNGFDFGLKNVCVIVVSLVNVATISWAISFVIGIIDPDNIDKAAKKLIRENKNLFAAGTADKGDSVRIGEFIEQFVVLEKAVRDLDAKYELSWQLRDKYKTYTPMNELFRTMLQRRLVDAQTVDALQEVNKVRNLAAHGQIDRVDRRISDMLAELVRKLQDVLNRNG